MALFALNYKCDRLFYLTTEVKYNDLQAKQLLLLSCVIHYTEIQMEANI